MKKPIKTKIIILRSSESLYLTNTIYFLYFQMIDIYIYASIHIQIHAEGDKAILFSPALLLLKLSILLQNTKFYFHAISLKGKFANT